jgi:iron(III) transport system permease protein
MVLPIAYLTARRPQASTSRVANALVATGFALPGIVIGFTFVTVLLRVDLLSQWYQTTPALITAYVVHFGIQALRSTQVAVAGVPARLGDAAASLGAGRLERLLRIELPVMRGGLAAGAGLVLLSVMKELPATLVLRPSGTDTLAVRIWEATETVSYGEAGLFALVLVAFSGVLTWLLVIRPLEQSGRV